MGCSTSEVGCLGPKPRERQVYVDQLQSIYHEASKLHQKSSQKYETQSFNLYKQIEDHLQKKGLLRKLIDNLISHKANIYECSNHNFQIALISNQKYSRIVSLIVIDKIMDGLLRKTENQNGDLTHKKHRDSSVNLHSELVDIQNYNFSFEGDPRINNLFCRQTIFLLQCDPDMYGNVIRSTIKYFSNKKEKITYKSEIFKLFDLFIESINQSKYVEETILAFRLVLEKLKQNVKQEDNQIQYFIFFIEYLSSQSSKSETVKSNCEKILEKYCSRYFQEYNIIYISLIKIFDSSKFKLQVIRRKWEIIKKIIIQEDINNSFMKGIFIYLLRYLIAHQNLPLETYSIYNIHQLEGKFKNIYLEESKLNAFRLMTQWIINKDVNIQDIIVYTSTMLVTAYIINITNCASRNIKGEWQTQFIKIINLMDCRSVQIILDILVEDMKNKQISNDKRMMFLSIIEEIVTSKKMLLTKQYIFSTNIIINVQYYFSLEANLAIARLVKIVIKNIKYELINSANQSCHRLRSHLCQSLYSFCNSILPQGQLRQQDIDYLNRLSNKSNLNDKDFKFLVQFKIAAEILSIIFTLLQQHLYIIAIPFLDSFNQSMKNMVLLENEETFLFLYLCQSIKRQSLNKVNRKQKLPDDMIKINFKVGDGCINAEIRNNIIDFTQKTINNCEITEEITEKQELHKVNSFNARLAQLSKVNSRRIQIAKEFCMISKLEYIEMMEVLKQCQRLHSQSLQKEASDLTKTFRHFNRSISVDQVFSEPSIQEGSITQNGEESFHNIIQKIQSF